MEDINKYNAERILTGSDENAVISELQKLSRMPRGSVPASLKPALKVLLTSTNLGLRFWAKKVWNLFPTSSPEAENQSQKNVEAKVEPVSDSILKKKLLEVPSAYISIDVIHRLCISQAPENLDFLKNYAQSCQDPIQLSFILKELGQHFPSPDMVVFLKSFLSHNDERVVANTIEGLEAVAIVAAISVPQVIVLFSQMLSHPSNRVCANASKALARQDPNVACCVLEKMLSRIDKPHFVISACYAIGQLKEASFLPMLRPLLSNECVASDALSAIISIGGDSACKTLEAALDDAISSTICSGIKSHLASKELQYAELPSPGKISSYDEEKKAGHSLGEKNPGKKYGLACTLIIALLQLMKKGMVLLFKSGVSLLKWLLTPENWKARMYLPVFVMLAFPPIGLFALYHTERLHPKRKRQIGFGISCIWLIIILWAGFFAKLPYPSNQTGPARPVKFGVSLESGQKLASSAENSLTSQANDLIIAIYQKNMARVKKEISLGSDPNGSYAEPSQEEINRSRSWDYRSIPSNLTGKTALSVAIEAGDLPILSYLLDNGVNIDLPLENGAGAMKKALLKQNSEIIDELFKRGARLSPDEATSLLIPLLERKRPHGLEIVVNAKPDLTAVDKKGNTAVHLAVDSGNASFLTCLLAAKAPLDMKNGKGLTPLHLAILGDKEKIVELLLANGADPNLKFGENVSPMDLAVENQRNEIAGLLFLNGAKGENKLATKDLPDAVRKGDLNKIREAVSQGANLKNSEYILHKAVELNNSDVVIYLLDQGFDVNALDKSGQSPLRLAKKNQKAEMASLLESRGGKEIDLKLKLKKAIEKGDSATVKYLLSIGINAEGEIDKKPILLYAMQKGMIDISKMLIESGITNGGSYYKTSALEAALELDDLELLDMIFNRTGMNDIRDFDTFLDIVFLKDSLTGLKFLMEKGLKDSYKYDKRLPLFLASCHFGAEKCARFLFNEEKLKETDYKYGTALHLAATSDNPSLCDFLISVGFDINAVCKHTMPGISYGYNLVVIEDVTPLHMAIGSLATETVRFLLDKGCNVMAVDSSGNTPVHWCFNNDLEVERQVEIIDLLLKAGADINARNKARQTPFDLISMSGNIRAIRTLLPFGVDYNLYPPMRESLSEKAYFKRLIDLHFFYKWIEQFGRQTPLQLAAVREPLAKFQEKIAGSQINQKGANDYTPLHVAAFMNRPDLIKIIVENGGIIDALAVNDITPLLLASSENCTEAAVALLEQGANPNVSTGKGSPVQVIYFPGMPVVRESIENYSGVTPLSQAVYLNNTKLVFALLDHGAVPTPGNLYFACNRGNLELVQRFLEMNCGPDASENSSTSPLHVAVENNGKYLKNNSSEPGPYVEIVKALIKKGARLDLLNELQMSPLDLALNNGDPVLAKVLIDAGAPIQTNMLFNMIIRRNAEMARLLIDHGVNLDQKNENGDTPLTLSEKIGVKSIVELLRSKMTENKTNKPYPSSAP